MRQRQRAAGVVVATLLGLLMGLGAWAEESAVPASVEAAQQQLEASQIKLREDQQALHGRLQELKTQRAASLQVENQAGADAIVEQIRQAKRDGRAQLRDDRRQIVQARRGRVQARRQARRIARQLNSPGP